MSNPQIDDLTVSLTSLDELQFSLFTNYVNLFAQSVRCTVGNRGIVYITVPITSGYNLFLLMDELKCSADEIKKNHDHRYREDVLEANARTAESWSAQARSAFPGRVVLDPSPLFIRGFEQVHYYDLWNKVIDLYADTVIATPKWAFSKGSRKEVEKAVKSGLKVVDMSGAAFSLDDLIRQDEEARLELASWGWSQQRIAEAIEPLDVNRDAEPQPPTNVVNTHWEDVLRTVNDDLLNFVMHRQPPVYSCIKDDERTRSSDKPLDTWRLERLQRYWDRIVSGTTLDDKSGLGRLELASLAGASVALLRSAVRVYGPLPLHRDMERVNWKQREHPGRIVLDYGDVHALNAVDAEVWTWIREEHRSMRRNFSEDTDDEMLISLVSGGGEGGWNGELWHEYFDLARHHGLATWEGRYKLGRFATGVLRMLESAVRVYGPIPRRRVRDVTRDELSTS